MKNALALMYAAVGLVVGAFIFAAEGKSGGAEKTKIVLVAGAPSHPSGQHEFFAGAKLLQRALNEQSGLPVTVEVVQGGWPEDNGVFEGASAIVIYSDGGGRHPAAPHLDYLDELMEEGVGLMCMHYGVDVPPGKFGDSFTKWLGGYYEGGFSTNPHWDADVEANGEHPVGRGVKPVRVNDEWYYNMRFPAEKKAQDFLTAVPTAEKIKRYIHWTKAGEEGLGKRQALMWGIEREDGGRGVGFTGGHWHRNWAIDDFRKAVLNAMVWTAGMDVPEGGVKSEAVTEAQLNENLDKKKEMVRVELPSEADFETPMAQMPAKYREPGGGKKNPGRKGNPQPKPAPKALYSSPVVTSKTEGHVVEIAVELDGAKKVFLVAGDAGDGFSCDWADWVNPRFVGADGKEVKLTDLKMVSGSTGWGNIRVGRNAGGGELKVNGEAVENGIGVHANSILEFDVPGGMTRFLAKGALDEGGVGQQDGKITSVKFEVFSERPRVSTAGTGGSFDPENGEFFSVPVEDFVTADPDLEVTVWAQSPMLFNPTNMDVDMDGRIWVAEGVNYRGHGGRRPEGDRIMVLEDTDGDGTADSSHCFVQEKFLAAPLGVAVIGNKVVVSCSPELVVYTDVDGDRIFDESKGDTREVLLTGFDGRQHDHSLHSVTVGPDGFWYFNCGNKGAKFTDKSGKTWNCGSPYSMKQVAGMPSDDGHVYIGGFTARMRPDGTDLEIIGHNYRNSYEQTVTSFGDVFQNDNDDPPACRTTFVLEYGNAGFASADGKRSWGADKRPGQSTPVAEWRQEDPGVMPAGDIYGGGSPTGIAFYENGALGEKHAGTLLSCEAARNVVFGYKPVPDGAGFRLERFDFLTSNAPDEGGERKFAGADFTGGGGAGKQLFRPSDVVVGADGAVYVSDWYDARVGGHSDRDGTCSGTIYRVAPKGFEPAVPKFDLETVEGQVAALKSPAVNVRALGFEGLKAGAGGEALDNILISSDKDPYFLSRALYLNTQIDAEGVSFAKQLIADSDMDWLRLVALRALRRAGAEVVELGKELADDPAAAVRREVATSLRDVPFAQSGEILLKLAEGFDGEDRTYLDAWGIGCMGKEAEVFAALPFAKSDPAKWTRAQGYLVWRLMTPGAVDALKKRALAPDVPAFDKKIAMDALAFIKTKPAGEAMVEIAATPAHPLQEGALWWVKHRENNDWKGMGLPAELDKRGIAGATPPELVAALAPEPAVGQAGPTAEEVLKLKGDVEKGKVVSARCVMCHEVEAGVGIDYGPGLAGWGKQFPADVVLKAILEPSAEIAHGYEGTEIRTKDGIVIHGRVLTDSDPVIVRSMGGIEQAVPKGRIASQKPLGRSLMLSAGQLGLTAQEVADLVAYLRE